MRTALVALVFVFLSALVVACEPAPMLPQTGAQIRVLVTDGVDGTGWLPWQREAIAAALANLNATGDQWVGVTGGESDVILRTFAAPSRGHLAGRYDTVRRIAEIDTVQTHGPDWLMLSVEHELLHHRTVGIPGGCLPPRDPATCVFHICIRPGDTDDCHPTVFGPAILNPELPADVWNEEYVVPRTALYQADLDVL